MGYNNYIKKGNNISDDGLKCLSENLSSITNLTELSIYSIILLI